MSSEHETVERVRLVQTLADEVPWIRDDVLFRSAVARLPTLLRRDEHPLMLDKGGIRWGTGLLVLTTERVMLVYDHLLKRQPKVTEVALADVAHASSGSSGGAGYIRLHLRRPQLLRRAREIVSISSRERADTFAAKINDHLPEPATADPGLILDR
jgi:hypothetical protein